MYFFLFSISSFTIFLTRLFQKYTNAKCKSPKRLDGKTAIVTGGTAGMGLEIAREFARRGARVIIACPFEEEGLGAQKTIIKETGNENVVFKFLNLGSLKSVREFAEGILKTEDRLDLLMNNAGIGTINYTNTADGMNVVLQINYYGHFLLTMLLLPLLKKSGRPSEPSRIVNTSSELHRFGTLDFEKLNSANVARRHYSESKLCAILFSRELARKLKGNHVVVNSIDPGAVGTDIFKGIGKLRGTVIAAMFNYMFKTPWEGAQTALHVALDAKAGEVSGEYFNECRQSLARTSLAYRDDLAEELWMDSVKRVQLSEKELEQSLN